MYNTQLISDLNHLGKPGSAERNQELLPLVASGDLNAREEMIRSNVALAYSAVAFHIQYRQLGKFLSDDLLSEAIVGICKAVNKIAQGHEVKYVTGFLSYWINREIRRAFERYDREFSNMLFLERRDNDASQDGDDPDDRERPATDKPVLEDQFALIDTRDMIHSCCRTDQEQRLIQLREEGKGCEEIAPLIGVSRATAFRMLKRIEGRFDEMNSA